MTKKYDVIILGGGAGLKIARPAANLGHKVAVVEPGPLGGTCLNRGCIPSKMLIHPADLIMQMKEANSVFLHIKGALQVDHESLVHHVNRTIDEESENIIPLIKDHPNINFYQTFAQFVEPYILKVGEETITAKKIYITAGARPYIPNIEGLEHTPYMTSTELLRCAHLPKKMIIIGAGYIACELGHYLDAMGVDVQFIYRSSFLKQLDLDIRSTFEKEFKERFPCIRGEPSKVEFSSNTFHVHINGGEIKSDGLLIAAGVIPNSDQLHLKSTSIQCDERGYIKVDDYLETTQKNVFAYGDIIGRYMFRHSANFEGEYLFHEHFTYPESNQPLRYSPMPYGVFTWPQIGGVGKTEEELKAENIGYYVGLNSYKSSAMGMALRPKVGFVKLLFAKSSLKLLGAHIIGEQATTLVHMLIAYLNMGATLENLLSTIYIHPALPEVIRNAARKVREQVHKDRI